MQPTTPRDGQSKLISDVRHRFLRYMVFQIQKVSNYRTSTPAVARTFYQGCEILGFFAVSDAQREEAKIEAKLAEI